jgi:hypothetical protein
MDRKSSPPPLVWASISLLPLGLGLTWFPLLFIFHGITAMAH